MALLLVFLPRILLEDDWQQARGEGSTGKSPQNLRLLLRPTVSHPSPSSLAEALQVQMAPIIGTIPNQGETTRRCKSHGAQEN